MDEPMSPHQDPQGLRATPQPAPLCSPTEHQAAEPEPEPALNGRQSGQVDDRQDQLMARDSVDGSPPSRRRRLAEWRWIVIVGPLLAIAAVAFAIMRGAGGAAIALGIVACLAYMLLAGWPVWGAGILRGKEERAARKEAMIEVREQHESTPVQS